MPSPQSRVFIASAGTGKTTAIVDQALALKDKCVLVTTYTNENADLIRSYFAERCGHVPSNIRIMTWYEFLLQECVRPYQNQLSDARRIGTIDFVSEPALYVARKEINKFYLNSRGDIFADRVTDFICTCDTISFGLIVKRLARLFDYIFIDEAQDLSGWDWDFLELLFCSPIAMVAVGDPRQAVLRTTTTTKNPSVTLASWAQGLAAKKILQIIEMTECQRCNQSICDFADALFPHLAKSKSKNLKVTGHDGVFPVPTATVQVYYDTHKPMALRYNKVTKTLGIEAFNIGAMKGRTFDRVLVFSTKKMRKYMQTKNPADAGDLEKFYVAVTRARFSVGIVVD